jgi:Skp family chaperone for outer membrane proteins
MRLAIIAAVIAILIGFGAGYLMWGERARQAIEERQRVTTELDAMKERQADELRKLREELAAERDRRQRLEEVISQGRK